MPRDQFLIRLDDVHLELLGKLIAIGPTKSTSHEHVLHSLDGFNK